MVTLSECKHRALDVGWFHAGSTQKSNAELDTLVKGVLLRDDFNTQDLRGFSTKAEHTRLDNAVDSKLDPKERLFPLHSGWERRSVKLALPAPKIKQKEADAPVFEVSGVMMWPLLAVMTEAFQGPEFQSFHITPFEECWDPLFQSRDRSSTTPATLINITRAPFTQLPPRHQWLYSEIYTSRKMMAAYCSLSVDPNVETIIAAFMFWSDSTHLANFGTASLWPLYTFFGNCSKHSRLKLSLHHCHHQAYIPSVSYMRRCTTTYHFLSFRILSMMTTITRPLGSLRQRRCLLISNESFYRVFGTCSSQQSSSPRMSME